MDFKKHGVADSGRGLCVAVALALVLLSFTARADSETMIKMEQGKIEFTRQNYDKAISLFEDVIEAEPENGEAQHYIGLCYMGKGDAWKAIPYLKRATKLCPCKVTSYEDLAWATYEAGQHDESIQASNKALALDPESDRGKLYKGMNLMSEGYYDRAMPYFKDLEDSKTYKQSGYYYQGVCLTRMGRTDEAANYFQRAKDADPDSDLGQHASRNLKGLEGMTMDGPSKPYYIKFRLLYQYDTNIVPVHDEDYLPEDVSEEEDGRIAADLDARYRFFENKNSYAQVRYLGYGNWHQEEEDVNLMFHKGGISGLRRFNAGGRGYGIGGVADYYYASVDNDYYSSEWSVRPTFYVYWSPQTTTRLVGEYFDETFDEPGEGENDRDNNGFSFSIYQHFYVMDGKVNPFVGYRFKQVAAEGDNYNRDENMVIGGVKAMLPLESKLLVYVRYEDRQFSDNVFDREEQETTASAQYQIPVYKSLNVYAGILYSTVDANVDFLEYDRMIYSGGLLVEL